MLESPGVDGLGAALDALRDWQHEGGPVQLHPGDLGWFWRFGAEAAAAAVRTWTRHGQVVAAGLLDSPTLLRLALAPDAHQDEELARELVGDLSEPQRGVLPAGTVFLEAPTGALLHSLLAEAGWARDVPWSPLRRDLGAPVRAPDLRIELIGPERAHVRTEVQRASFDSSSFTDERWLTMAAGPLYGEARCLVGYDDAGNAVAATTVWSAGPGRPGLIEPLGVHREQRGHGFGTAITLAAAGALQEMGSSSALVSTPSSNVGGVATYRSAGFEPLPQRHDLRRDA